MVGAGAGAGRKTLVRSGNLEIDRSVKKNFEFEIARPILPLNKRKNKPQTK